MIVAFAHKTWSSERETVSEPLKAVREVKRSAIKWSEKCTITCKPLVRNVAHSVLRNCESRTNRNRKKYQGGNRVMKDLADIVAADITGERGIGKYTGRRPSPTQGEIAQLAFTLYDSRGRQDGHDIEDWLRAEQELVRHYS
jgi:Protein of unknown function (DUF2934)